MKLIILDPRRGISRTLHLPRVWPWLLAVALLVLPLMGGLGGYWLRASGEGDALVSGNVGRDTAVAWRERLAAQKEAVAATRAAAEERLKALTVRVAEMQARLLRLDALGERLVRTTRIGKDEFDFRRPPAVGGPDEGSAAAAYVQPDFIGTLDQLASRIDAREEELKVLERLLAGGRLREESFLAGNPVRVGYLSSDFGRRIDPFHGSIAFHRGVDFAGPEGADIVATGAGIVTFAGSTAGYGNMVEVSHGDGITTVYAHASKVEVRVGDIVQEGQVLARLGSTGRSTGPHVHYEVRRSGQPINPAHYNLAASTRPASGG